MAIRIEKGIPVPVVRRGREEYPWDRMVPGDSFLATTDVKKVARMQALAKTRPEKYVVRRVRGGVRVWRV